MCQSVFPTSEEYRRKVVEELKQKREKERKRVRSISPPNEKRKSNETVRMRLQKKMSERK